MHADLWSELLKPKPYNLEDRLKLNSIDWRISMQNKDYNFFASSKQENLTALRYKTTVAMRPINYKPRRNSLQPVGSM